jgi:hypothetical protein
LLPAEHPRSQCSEVRAAVASAVSDPSGKDQVFECDVALTPAAVVTGRVILPQGWTSPLDAQGERLGDVRAGLFEFAAGEAREIGSVNEAFCDAAGHFTLRANRSGEFRIIAVVDGLETQARRAELRLGTSLDVGAIELSAGASISGRVLRAGASIGAGAVVMAMPAEKPYSYVSWSTASSVWGGMQQSGERIYRSYVRAATDAPGHYQLDGLEPVPYELYVESVPAPAATAGGRPRIERTVQAPQANVDLVMLPPTVRLSLSFDGHAPQAGDLEGVTVRLAPTVAEYGAMNLDLSNRQALYGLIELQPDLDYEFRVAAGRCEALVGFVPAMAMSEERDVLLALKTRANAGALHVRLVGEGAENIESASFARIEPEASADAWPDWKVLKRSTDGSFVLANLPSGKNRLAVDTCRPFQTITGTPYLAAEFEIELPENKSIARDLLLEIGSRIRLSCKDERGGFVRATVELRDARGDKLRTDFFCLTPGMGYGCGWYLCEQGINDHPPLRAGHYELTLSAEGFETQQTPLDLVQGETRTIEVVLRRR